MEFHNQGRSDAWRGAVELFPGWESLSEEDAAESTARETAAQSAPP